MGRLLDEIRTLDPERDAQRIVFIDACLEFPWDTQRSLELAFYRTYAVPSIAELLASTGEFTERAQKRYDDTQLLISAFCEHGYDGGLGRRAIKRMNRIHGRFEIANDDFLYVLSTMVFEPIRWNARFGWRPLIETERLATFYFWREVGTLMAIRDIPEDYDDVRALQRRVRARALRLHRRRRTASARRRATCSSAGSPACRKSVGRPLVHALLDEPLLDALGFPHPPRAAPPRAPRRASRARSRAVRLLPAAPQAAPAHRGTAPQLPGALGDRRARAAAVRSGARPGATLTPPAP